MAARLRVDVDKMALTIPDRAVQRGPDGLFVYVVGADNRAVTRPVTLAHEDADDGGRRQGAERGRKGGDSWLFRLAAGRARRRRSRSRRRELSRCTKASSGPFIRHPVATTLIMVAILLAGVVAYPLLPVAPLPQIDFPTITVSASLPGASPDTMASSVAQPLERQIAQIPGVSQMTSTSSLGATAITVQFDLDRNIDAAANDIQAAINAASGQLPKNLPSPPTYRKVNPSDAPILILSVSSDTAPDHRGRRRDREHSRSADQPDLRRVAGARRRPAAAGDPHPDRPGQARREEPAARGRARADRASPRSTAPRARSTASGRPSRSSTTTSLLHAKAWNDIIVAYRNGAPVRMRDIGKAVDGPADDTQAAWGNGKRDVFLVIFKQPGVNVIKTVEKIKQTMTHLEAAIPASMHVAILSDRTTTIRASVDDVQFTLVLTIVLVVIGDLRLPAQLLGDVHPQRHRAAGAARRLRA